MPKVQTTSVKNGENRGVVGEVVCVLGTSVSVVVAALAAGPLCWQHEPFNAQLNPIGQPAQATTYRVNVRIIGPACGSPGQHAS